VSDQDVRLRSRLAERASFDPEFIGYVLDRYCTAEGITTRSLVGLLRIDEAVLPSLRLCRRPRVDQFGEDIIAVAAHVGADVIALAAILREASAIDAMTGDSISERGFLLAARERYVVPSTSSDSDVRKEGRGVHKGEDD
jgi:hypothetical protein